ncbi:MAG: hypothetical protein IJU23_13590 [Proteobacteria bacterium]|nr:hypothetical protein [Pseudomonadota bacterium]
MIRRVLKLAIAILILCAISGCKETPTRHQNKKNQAPQYDIEKVSKNIERFTATDNPEPVAEPIVEPPHLILDLPASLKDLPSNDMGPQIERSTISQFPSDTQTQIVRVSINLRGVPRTAQDDVENRIMNLLSAHAPQPWDLRKANSIDSHETVVGRLNVDFKRQTLRLRRVSKTAPQRADVSFSFAMSYSVAKGTKSSWHDWHYDYHDEIALASENAASASFWQRLEDEFPVLTVIHEDETAQWLRAQGLLPQVLTNDLSAFRLTGHQYYPSGCLVSSNANRTLELRRLQSPYSPPHNLEVSSVLDMACFRDATFIVAPETPIRLALFYQPTNKKHAWKSQLTFADSIKSGDLAMHIDDDLLCLYTGMEPTQNRGVEIQCLDRKTGLMRWQTKRLSGALRGIAFDDHKIAFANDQALFEISRDGKIETVKRLQTSSRLRNRLSCQLQNRMIFMTGPGQFVSWNLDSHEFDWQTAVFDSDFIHCSQHNILLISEVGGYLLAWDVETRTPMWKYRTVSTPIDAFSYGEMIYILLDRAIIVLDRATGRQRAQIPLPWAAQKFIQMGHNLYLDTKDAVYTWR